MRITSELIGGLYYLGACFHHDGHQEEGKAVWALADFLVERTVQSASVDQVAALLQHGGAE